MRNPSASRWTTPEELPTTPPPAVGFSLGGPGKVVGEADGIMDAAPAFQLQVGGLPRGFAYRLNGVNFNGFSNDLIEAKGLGYASLIKDPRIAERLANNVVAQASRQLRAAGKTTIRWVVEEEEFARGLRRVFDDAGITQIEVIHQAPRFPLQP